MLDAALDYATRGWAVFPLGERSKIPKIKGGNGVLEATTDEAQIRSWWERWPNANIGLATGMRSGFVVVDVDPPAGEDTLETFTRVHGEPNTVTAITGRDGTHYLFAYDQPLSGLNGAGPNLDVKADGGYIVAPPSIHPSGRPYLWLAEPDSIPLEVLPAWVPAALAERRSNGSTTPEADALRSMEERLNEPNERDDGVRPGDDFNARTTWPEIMDQHGWVEMYTRGGETMWRRPGKGDHGGSATTNHNGTDHLKVFSTSTPFDTQGTYDRFGAYAVLNHGGDLQAAARALQEAGYGTPSTPSPPAPVGPTTDAPEDVPGRPTDDDIGNGLRFWRLHRDRIRYVARWKTWYVWTGSHWAEDDAEVRALGLAKDIVPEIWRDIAAIKKTSDQKRAITHARASARVPRLKATLEASRDLPGISIDPATFDRDPNLLNVTNGTLDLTTGHLRAHDPDDLMTKLADVTHDAHATAPTWAAFLERVIPDPEVRHFLQLFAGYALTGNVDEHVLLLLVGVGRNGKSTFANALRDMLGDYGSIARKDLLVVTRNGQHDTSRGVLEGRRLVTASELERGAQFAESEIKELTGESRLSSRRLYSKVHEFAATHKLMISANYRPQVEGTDEAIWRRIRLVEWPVTIPEDEQDTSLPSRLRAESAGILNWALAGLAEWREHGLSEPAAVILATASYRENENQVGRFLTESGLVIDPSDPLMRTDTKILKSLLEQWTTETEEKLAFTTVTTYLKRLGAVNGRNNASRYWKHVGRPEEGDAVTRGDAPLEESHNAQARENGLSGNPVTPRHRVTDSERDDINSHLDPGDPWTVI